MPELASTIGQEQAPAEAAAPSSSSVLLSIQGLRRAFGGVVAVESVAFDVLRGQIKAVIGPNGAGKTTLFNIISGVIKPDAGTITFAGRQISGLRPYQVGRSGISRTFQNLSLFDNMSVLENVMVGSHCRTRSGILSAVLRLPLHHREERRVRETAMRNLEIVGLAEEAAAPVGDLPFGKRRMVELARALSTEPQLLLLDEPASGLNTRETDDLGVIIRKIRDTGITILLVEHDMSLVMEISDSIFVMNYGKPVAEGDPTTIQNDKRVISVYLGGDFDGAAH